MRTTGWLGAILGAMAVAAIASSCGGTGGGGGGDDGGGSPVSQFILNSNNSGRLSLNVNPGTVDANKSDRIGLVAVLTDSQGHGVSGVPVTFTSEIDDIEFIPNETDDSGHNFGLAVTDANGRADIIAIAGASPTGTGEIIGTGAIFATVPQSFGLRAQVQVTLTDVGFIDADELAVIPASITLVEPAPGQVIFFTIVGGTPPYFLTNEVSGIGAAAIGQHCLPGCTENDGILCIGSPCRNDTECNQNGSSSPAGVCLGEIKHCLASCSGSNCGGSRCEIDADCNDGSSSPADVCQDSGQSIAYIIAANPAGGTHSFTVHDSAGATATVEVTVSFVCGNGIARGDEQCDLGDLRGATCEDLGRPAGSLVCGTDCTFDTTGCVASPTPAGGATPTNGAVTPTGPTPTGVTPTPTAVGTPGNVSTLDIAVGDPNTNVGADNGNNTATAVIAAIASDAIGNPVQDGTLVSFSLTGPTFGAVITAQSATGNLPPQCDIANYVQRTGIQVLEQPGVAHACITYPINNVGQNVTVHASSGSAPPDDDQFTLPVALVNPNPEPTSTP